ncbi:MAG: fused MFS/spermidine synthase, partial [Sedimentisphaerales bacterium]|nr:fused MFS/spermidine synthase [Sedimentisphaerales bacterium]
MSRFRGSLRMVVPSVTVFFSSGCLGLLMLTGFRLVARHLGSSLYTWTAVIATVLVGVAAGNYLGGRMAARYHSRRTLSVLFGLSSAACVTIVIVNNLAGEWLGLWRLSWPMHVFIHTSLVFLFPSCLMGAIIPVAAKTAMEKGMVAGSQAGDVGTTPEAVAIPFASSGEVGRVVGTVYAWSAAGAIAAIVLGGFLLIPATGNTAVLWLLGAAMLMAAVLYWVSCWALYLWAMVFMALATMGMTPAKWAQGTVMAALLREPFDPNILYAGRTPYGYVAVRQTSKRPDRRELIQDGLTRNEAVMGDMTSLQYFSTKVCAGLTQALIADRGKPAMMVIGGSGYVLPLYLKALWPGSVVEVVEPDPGLVRAAEALGLERSSSIETICMDARVYVDGLLRSERAGKGARRYDVIYEDTFHDYAVPFPLMTREFNDRVSRLLVDDGVYMVNLIDTREDGRLLGAVICTLEQTFPSLHVVTPGEGGLPSPRNSIVVVAAKRGLDVQAALRKRDQYLSFEVLNASQRERLRDACGGIILTDDYAPVEDMLAGALRQGSKAILARRYRDRARSLQNQGRRDLRHAWELPRGEPYDPSAAMRRRGLEEWERSIAQYEQAIELDPSLSIDAYNEIGKMRVEQDKLEDAVGVFHRAIDYHRKAGLQDPAIASVYRNLGMLL